MVFKVSVAKRLLSDKLRYNAPFSVLGDVAIALYLDREKAATYTFTHHLTNYYAYSRGEFFLLGKGFKPLLIVATYMHKNNTTSLWKLYRLHTTCLCLAFSKSSFSN